MKSDVLATERESREYVYLFEIDFSICAHARLTVEIDNPFFTFVLGEVQWLQQIPKTTSDHTLKTSRTDSPNINPLMYPTIRLTN